ncbi:MAG: hypothetical protein EG828_09185 [Deltaproteobacteria bacterium]|nr:hypothetical protein [Deltaproteobacteria bacterium]
MELLQELLKKPFTLGLLLGLACALVIAGSSWRKRRSLRKDACQLREHLHCQMTIQTKGNQAILEEIEQLKQQNENLRISLAALKNRPDKSELQRLFLYDKALQRMHEKAPGFAIVWESVIKEAEIEMEKTSSGLIAWARKIVRPAGAAEPSRSSMTGSQSEQAITITTSNENSEHDAGGEG